MFCPKCGQQQSSDGVRFCSRCGFQLEVVKELLVTDGAPPLWPEAETDRSHRSPRNRGIRQGVMLMLLTALIVPVTALLSKVGLLPREFVALAAIICAVGGFMRLVYALMFEESARNKKRPAPAAPAPPQQLRAGAAARSLPPQQSRPESDFYKGRRTETAEIAQPPPSVTENTTKLLEHTNDD
jgi:zinc-ribbon domain